MSISSICGTAALALSLAIVGSAAAAPPAASPSAAETDAEAMFQLLAAEMALQQGDAATAYATFMDVARKTKDPRVARRATEIAIGARALPQALEAARLWRTLAPDSEEAQQSLGALLLGLGRYDEALPVFAAPVKRNPLEELATVQRLLARAQDRAAALAFLDRLAQPYVDDPKIGADVRLTLAVAAHSAGQSARAVQQLQAALTLRPDFERAAVAAAQLLSRTADGKESAAGRAQALVLLRDFVERNPNAIDARLAYARLLVADNKFAQAQEQFGRALEADPRNAEALFAAALLAIEAGPPYGRAREYLQRYLQVVAGDPGARRSPDPAYLNLARIAEEEGNYQEAIEWLDRIGAGDSALNARARKALVLGKMKRVDEARRLLAETEVDSPAQRIWLTIAEAQMLREAGRLQASYDLLLAALAQTPDDAGLLYDASMAAEKLDRLDGMEKHLRRLIELNPADAQAYNALGYALADRNLRLAEANALIGEALKHAPDDANILDSRGWVYYRMGKLPEAREYLERSWVQRRNAEVGAHLGEVLWQMGERDAARRIWTEAAKLDPGNETLTATLARFKVKL